ncbi:MAG: hypothetical protein A2Y12_18150 [Planctomycetes bacterium GWF2_42_9]|nr:MAG: hypothetical protein A2Y12_18150 [Planctomycetes bacterium GWF2_42_9]HAL44606.1 hypothetical protein [Phycisphaerales bacterium]
MNNKMKLGLLTLIAIGLIVQTFFSQKIGTVILIISAIIFVAWVFDESIATNINPIYKRLERIEKPLGLLDSVTDEDTLKKPLSYRINLVLMPQWEEILKKLASQNNQTPEEFIKEIFSDEKLNLNNEDKSKNLFGKFFSFVIFQDEITGMEQIWSDYHKTFVNKITVCGQTFAGLDTLTALSENSNRKYADNLISKPLILKPNLAAFDELYYQQNLHLHVLSNIPYYDIIRLLKYTTGYHQYAIKRFPDDIKKKLDEENVKYKISTGSFEEHAILVGENFNGKANEYYNNKWGKDRGIELYNQEVEEHIFETQYYSISISIESFETARKPVFKYS